MENSNIENKYLRAQKRVKEIKKFYSSIFSYVFVIAMLAGLNYFMDEWQSKWFLWVALFWGIGIVLKGIKVFGMNPFFGSGWEERKINEIMNEEKEQSRWR